MSAVLEKEFEFYIQHQDELVQEHLGEYVVIKEDCVLGFYNSISEALEVTRKSHALGSFFVHLVGAGSENYTGHFVSPLLA